MFAFRQIFIKPSYFSKCQFNHRFISSHTNFTNIYDNQVMFGRVMLPDDANVVGNVHGGTILQMIELTGFIAAMRHCNKENLPNPLFAALVRLETMDFLKPVHIGDLASLSSRVIFSTKRVMEVSVEVCSENFHTKEKKVTNKATLWYVAINTNSEEIKSKTWLSGKPKLKALEVLPEVSGLTSYEIEQGKKRHLAMKDRRLKEEKYQMTWRQNIIDDQRYTFPSIQFAQLALPSDCTPSGLVYGGVIMKIMDNAAAIIGVRHCKTNVVTASIEAVNFIAPIFNGDIILVTARAAFTSAKTIDVELVVHSEDPASGERKLSCTATYTFVSLDNLDKTQNIPPLKPITNEDKELFARGERRYLERKKLREAKKIEENK